MYLSLTKNLPTNYTMFIQFVCEYNDIDCHSIFTPTEDKHVYRATVLRWNTLVSFNIYKRKQALSFVKEISMYV